MRPKRRPPAFALIPTTMATTSHVHHQEIVATTHISQGRGRHARPSADGFDDSRQHPARADGGGTEAAVHGHLLSARHGPWALGTGRRRRAAREAALHSRAARERQGPDGGTEGPVVE